MQPEILRLRSRVDVLARVIKVVSNSLTAPELRGNHLWRGFRYSTPDIRHFCLLKAVRIVSALNAALKLAEGGYTQEIAVLMRTMVECATHIEYVLDRNDSDAHRAAVSKYVREFFEDDQRGVGAEIRRAQVRRVMSMRRLARR
jgi:hypothetical protein